MKELIKKIPIIGWFIRWINTLLRLNNLKFIILEQQKRINEQEKRINEQEKRINEQERIDQFIFDNKIDLKKNTLFDEN